MSISDATLALDQGKRELPVPDRSVGVDARPEGANLEAEHARAQPQQTARRAATIAEHSSSRRRGIAARWSLALARGLATLAIALIAALMAYAIWSDYVDTGWPCARAGRERGPAGFRSD